MPLVEAEMLWSREGLGGPVLVRWGKIVSAGPDLVAAAGQNFFIFAPENAGYSEIASVNTGTTILSLAVGLPSGGRDNIVVGTEDRILVYGIRGGGIVLLAETAAEPGARFVDLALADLDGDGREEVAAAAENRDAVFIYRQGQSTDVLSLEFLAVDLLPGSAQRLAVLFGTGAPAPLLAVAYRQGDSSGILTLYYTETGFAEGPFIEMLSAQVTAMTAADLTPPPGDELAWAGADGRVRVMEAGAELRIAVTTDNLGNSVPALAAGMIAGEPKDSLIAGTSEGFLFGFLAPVEKSSPDWAVFAGRPLRSLAIDGGARLAVGSEDEAAEVWRVLAPGVLLHVVREGDTLYTIAERYQVEAAAIAAANNIAEPNLIYPGQELVIPR